MRDRRGPVRNPDEVAAFAQAGEPYEAVPDDRAAVLASITASYFYLRRGLAALGFAFPLVLWLGADPRHLQTAISAYYHYAPGGSAYGGGVMRDLFVGILWAVGAGLFL